MSPVHLWRLTWLQLLRSQNVWSELQKRADRADQSVLFFLAGANFWEKHAKNCAIMSMAHITYAIGSLLKTSLLSYCDYTGGTSSPWPTRRTQL